MIQRRSVKLAPELLLVSLVSTSGLFGTLGMLLAAPLAVVAFVLFKLLYVGEVPQDEDPSPGFARYFCLQREKVSTAQLRPDHERNILSGSLTPVPGRQRTSIYSLSKSAFGQKRT